MSMHKTLLTELERDNYTLAAEVGRPVIENEALREENERLRKDAERMNGDIADLRQLIARYRERELTMGWNQE